MYFTESETAIFLDNISESFSRHTEAAGLLLTLRHLLCIMHIRLAKIFSGDYARRSLENIGEKARTKSDINLRDFTMIINPENVQEGSNKAMQFLRSHGLKAEKAERMILADYMPDNLADIAGINTVQGRQLQAVMRDIAFWKVTLDDNSQQIHEYESEMHSEKFDLNANIISGRLELTFTGRIDTLNAPEILAFYQKIADEHEFNALLINCIGLDYISSSGLRILLIVHKRTRNGVTLKNINPSVREIIAQIGFDSIFNVQE